MGLKTIALDDPSERGCRLFGTTRIQFNPITPRTGIMKDRCECQPFADARVQCRKCLAGKSQEASDSLRFSGRKWVIVAADFRIEARHTETPVLGMVAFKSRDNGSGPLPRA